MNESWCSRVACATSTPLPPGRANSLWRTMCFNPFRKNKKPSPSSQPTTQTNEEFSLRPPQPSPSATQAPPAPKSTSANAKASLNAFKIMLDALGKSPIPGIVVATSVFTRIIENLQAMSDATVGWQRLADRLERLVLILDTISNMVKDEPEIRGRAESTCASLNDALRKLADDIDQAKAENKFSAFLNSTDELSAIAVHDKKLDSIIGDLTLILCMFIPLTMKGMEAAFNDMIARIQETTSEGNSGDDGVSVNMVENIIKTKTFRSGVDNQLMGRARVNLGLHGNKFVSELDDAVVEVGVNNTVVGWDMDYKNGGWDG